MFSNHRLLMAAYRNPTFRSPHAAAASSDAGDSDHQSSSARATANGQPITLLAGKALLVKARALSNRSEDDIARARGYVGPSGRVLKKSFYRALVTAKGYRLPSQTGSSAPVGSKGRQAEFRTRVHGNGNLLIGQAYTRRMGLEPGQEFRIEIHRESGSIWLLPMENEPELNIGTTSTDS